MMEIILTEDIKPVSELKRNTAALLNQVRTSGRPLILTSKGKADVILMDVKLFEKWFGKVKMI